ncbi:MAG: HD domain-containing protein [Nanoarchaeota archaeon]
MLEKIREIVREAAEKDDWKYHILPVVEYAKILAKMLHADEELVEIAALLHDIGRLRFGGEDHDVTGVSEAERILRELGCSADMIDEVTHCVATHRSRKENMPNSLIAKIVANADAMAHFDSLPIFFYWRSKKESFEEAFKWVDDKIERDWNQKLTIPEAKKMMEEKYRAIRLILDATKKYQ